MTMEDTIDALEVFLSAKNAQSAYEKRSIIDAVRLEKCSKNNPFAMENPPQLGKILVVKIENLC